MARAQGKHREFGINWSVATLTVVGGKRQIMFDHETINLLIFRVFE